MANNRRALAIPVLLITIGSGWLLTAMGVAPGVDWLWILGLGVVGILTFALWGWDKATFVAGPFFIIASFLSLLRQSGRLNFEVEVPILVITLGVLLLAARLPGIPMPRWIESAEA